MNLSNTTYSSSLNTTTNGETVPLTTGFCNSNNLRTPIRSRPSSVQTRQFTVRIERIGADTPHITLTNNHNGNGEIIDSEDDEDTDAILYANDQKSVGTQAKLL